MKKRQIFLSGLLCLFVLVVPCLAKEWRNIFPLKTTRTEVLKLLGEPAKRWETGGEYFEVENGRITISWLLPDCYLQSVLSEGAIKADSVVNQITFVPKAPLPIEHVEKLQPTSELFFVYDGNCLRGGNGYFSCHLMSWKYGFGYSNSNNGVTEIYYFPNEKESTDWKEKLKPCSVK